MTTAYATTTATVDPATYRRNGYVWAVICPDESIQHDEPFSTRRAATHWATWQHSTCVYPAYRHTFQRLER